MNLNLKRLVSFVFSFGLIFAAGQVLAELTASGTQKVNEADVVYKNGFVYTVDAVRSRPQAFAIRDGKFLVVGSNGYTESTRRRN